MAKYKQTLLCGCIVAIDYDETPKIIYCPMHKAAPKLYEALKAIIQEDCADGASERTVHKGAKALAKAEGK